MDARHDTDAVDERRLVEAAQRDAAALAAATPRDGSGGWGADSLDGLLANGLPGYQIIREIHRGGQGVVYQAIQKSTGREVAIKVTREGPFAGPRDKARFEREVHILAQLNHPHIVAIHDGGEASGHFFFVMDLVSGCPLDEHVRATMRPGRANAARSTIREVLRVFVQICDAIHAAHLRGIIHRDLKPGNIRVDAQGEPHVLDFGLARVLDDRGTSSIESLTATGQFIGSLPWASPEQAGGSPGHIDIRTDVYSLGVVLYELLTGRFPYPVAGNMRDVLNNIIQADPIRPTSFAVGLDDELEALILKCIAKEPDRRYQSAGDLGRDIRRYLAGEPIEAKRDSSWYLLRKILRRHRGRAVGVAAFVLLSVCSAVSLAVLLQESRDARSLAEDRLKEISAARDAEEAARHAAERHAQKAAAVQEFLQQTLAAVNPDNAAGRNLDVLRDVLDEAAERIETEFAAQPDLEAAVRDTLGRAYQGLGLLDEAELHLCEALAMRRMLHGDGPHQDLAVSLNNVGLLLTDRGEHEAARQHLEEALWAVHELLGDENVTMANTKCSLATVMRALGGHGAAEMLARDALTLHQRSLGQDHRDVAHSLICLGLVLKDKGEYGESESLLRRAAHIYRAASGAESTRLVTALANLASILQATGDFADARGVYDELLPLERKLLGAEHPRLATTLNNHASLVKAMGDYAAAEPLYREALHILRTCHGQEHPNVANLLTNLGDLLDKLGRKAEAEFALREALQLQRTLLGPEHPNLAKSLNNLAAVLKARRNFDEAAPLYREALAIARHSYGTDHPDVAIYLNNLADLALTAGDNEQAETLYREAIDVWRHRLGDTHPHVGMGLSNLALVLRARGRHEQAESLLRESLAILRNALGDDHPHVATAMTRLAQILNTAESYAEAEALSREALRVRRKLLPANHMDIAVALLELGVTLLETDRAAEAGPLLRESLEIRRHSLSPADWRIGNAESVLGAALAAMGRHDEAEALLVHGLTIVQDDPCAKPETRQAAIRRAVRFYEQSGRPEAASLYHAPTVAASQPGVTSGDTARNPTNGS